MKYAKILVMTICCAVLYMGCIGRVLAASTDAKRATVEKRWTKSEEPDFDNLDENTIIRNEKSEIVGIDVTEWPVSPKYEDYNYLELKESAQFSEYKKLGMTCDDENNIFFFYDRPVIFFKDEYKEGSVIQYYNMDLVGNMEAVEVNGQPGIYITAIRGSAYQLLYFEFERDRDTTPDYESWEDDEYYLEEDDAFWDEESFPGEYKVNHKTDFIRDGELLHLYEKYGISYDEQGMFYYHDQLVRYFNDGYEYVEDGETIGRVNHYEFLNEDGTIDVHVVRDTDMMIQNSSWTEGIEDIVPYTQDELKTQGIGMLIYGLTGRDVYDALGASQD